MKSDKMSYIENPVQIITRRYAPQNQKIVIDYPVVVGLPNPAVQQKLNTSIINLVNRLMHDQTEQLINQGYKQLNLNVQGFYEIKTNERGVLSLSIGNYTIAIPAAHGMTIIKSLTFDIQTGREYQLYDLFKPGSDYVKVLSGIISQQIKQRNIILLNGFKSIKPNQDFYIADKVLVIYFQLYELTAYVFGFPQFPVSVYEIQDIVREDGPLGKMSING